MGRATGALAEADADYAAAREHFAEVERRHRAERKLASEWLYRSSERWQAMKRAHDAAPPPGGDGAGPGTGEGEGDDG